MSHLRDAVLLVLVLVMVVVWLRSMACCRVLFRSLLQCGVHMLLVHTVGLEGGEPCLVRGKASSARSKTSVRACMLAIRQTEASD